MEMTVKEKNDLINEYVANSEFNRATIGLVNMGFTCYMNASLQCLVNITPLSIFFSSGLYKKYIDATMEKHQDDPEPEREQWNKLKVLVDEFANFINGYRGQNNKIEAGRFEPAAFFTAFSAIHSEFKLGVQMDLSEFMRSFIEDICKIISEASIDDTNLKTPFIEQLCEFGISDTIKCETCKTEVVKVSNSTFFQLSPVNRNSSDPCVKSLDDYFKNNLSADLVQDFKCVTCKTQCTVSKRPSICKLPPYFVLETSRDYYIDPEGPVQAKYEGDVIYPLDDLCFDDYVKESEDNLKGIYYEATTIICHIGTVYAEENSGHYVCYCKKGDKWFF